MALYFLHTDTTLALFFLVFYMIASIALESIYSATSGGTNGNNDSGDLDSSKHELEPIADWTEYGDYEVWVAVREMLESLPRNSHRKLLQQQTEEFPGSPDIPVTESLELVKAKNTKDTDSYEPLEKGGTDGFTLEKTIADMLLKGRVYFIHFPSVYCYDENHIIFRVGEGHRYQQVTSITPNPPEPQAPFDIGGIKYAFDQTGVLWYTMGEYWLQEVTYSELSEALSVVVNCIEADNLHITANPIYSPSSSDPGQSTSTESVMSDTTMNAPGEGPQPLSSNPDQAEVDQWMEDMKRHRAMQVKDGIRLSTVRCPVPGCGKTQRRPQALRDHLYFHFSIKPHRCDYGCAIAFETEANKNRHLETCPLAAQWGNH